MVTPFLCCAADLQLIRAEHLPNKLCCLSSRLGQKIGVVHGVVDDHGIHLPKHFVHQCHDDDLSGFSVFLHPFPYGLGILIVPQSRPSADIEHGADLVASHAADGPLGASQARCRLLHQA